MDDHQFGYNWKEDPAPKLDLDLSYFINQWIEMYFKNSDYTNKKYEDLYLNVFVDIIFQILKFTFAPISLKKKKHLSGILQLVLISLDIICKEHVR